MHPTAVTNRLNSSQVVCKYYPAEHYLTLFNKETGFFLRCEDTGCPEPFWSEHGPELLDISITNWCDLGCAICYRDATPQGYFMPPEDFRMILEQAVSMDTCQIAIGGGNPNAHPDFCEFLRMARSDYGIVPSYTTNGRQLNEDVLKATEKYCGAIAVSAHDSDEKTFALIKRLCAGGIKTNIHFVLTATSIARAIRWLKEPELLPEELNAIVFLNYKPVGKLQNEALLLKNSSPPGHLKEFFSLIKENKYPFKIGFDSCMVSGIVKYTDFPPVFYDFCESGRFSAFIAEDLNLYPCSFMVESFRGINLRRHSILQAWREGDTFVKVRAQLKEAACDCPQLPHCKGGCPVLPEINLCT